MLPLARPVLHHHGNAPPRAESLAQRARQDVDAGARENGTTSVTGRLGYVVCATAEPAASIASNRTANLISLPVRRGCASRG